MKNILKEILGLLLIMAGIIGISIILTSCSKEEEEARKKVEEETIKARKKIEDLFSDNVISLGSVDKALQSIQLEEYKERIKKASAEYVELLRVATKYEGLQKGDTAKRDAERKKEYIKSQLDAYNKLKKEIDDINNEKKEADYLENGTSQFHSDLKKFEEEEEKRLTKYKAEREEEEKNVFGYTGYVDNNDGTKAKEAADKAARTYADLLKNDEKHNKLKALNNRLDEESLKAGKLLQKQVEAQENKLKNRNRVVDEFGHSITFGEYHLRKTTAEYEAQLSIVESIKTQIEDLNKKEETSVKTTQKKVDLEREATEHLKKQL